MTDFGHGAPRARALMQALSDALAEALESQRNAKVGMLFEEWRTLYGQVAEMSVLQADAVDRELRFSWPGRPGDSIPGRLFVVHTYNALLIKLLAGEIVSAYGLASVRQPARAMAALLDDAALLRALSRDIERGGIFSQAGIAGFVEEAIFSWYLDSCANPANAAALIPALRNVLAAVSLYRADRLTRSRDVLRDLYIGLVPGKLRQRLGEFYTPDWLVDLTLDKAQGEPWLKRRVLDPTCGSGAFLLATLRRMRAEAANAGWHPQRILERLCASVWGFDLNPLAIQTARVNFLMEIADLLAAVPGYRLEIPVVLADAIYSPAPDPARSRSAVQYRGGSAVAGLRIALPSALAFDRIVGNPPWVRWSKLPDAYRERVKPTCERYGIFSRTKRHGGNELDISAMIAYATADKWLTTGGRMAFVIRGELFRNPSSAGFREFRLEPANPDTLHLAPVAVDDMKALKPFEDATNHTAVAVFDKRETPGSYPVPYRVWKSAPGHSAAIPATLTLPEVLERVTIESKEAMPVGDAGSPWAILAVGRHAQLRTLSGTCAWAAGRKGITTDLNGIYFVSVARHNGAAVQVRSRPDAGKKPIGPAKTAWVESQLLYPLVKGAGDFSACYLRLAAAHAGADALYAFVPNRGISKGDYAASAAALSAPTLAKTRAWFAAYRSLLESRSTYRRQMAGAPYFAVYNVGDYTFQPWKVMWPEMSSRFYAAVAGSAPVPGVGERPYVPDHKVYFAAFDDRDTAYFLCGLLNGTLVREWVESHNVSIQVGDIFKHMTLPRYRAEDAEHAALVDLVGAAHGQHDAAQRQQTLTLVARTADAILQTWMRAVAATPAG